MAVPDGTTQEQDTGEEIPGQQNLTLPYSTQVAVPMVGQRTPYLGTNIAPYAGTINASLSGTWPMPTATVIPGPPHLPPTGVSLHSGTYDFISADADDQAAVLVMLDTLLNTTYGPMPSPQQVKLLETMLRATPEQLRISGNQAVLDNLEAAGYFSSVERDRALAEGVVESYQTTWTQDQKDMWDRLGRRQAGAVYGGAGGLSWLTTDPSRVAGDEAPFSQAETENRLRQMQAIYGDTLRMAGDAGTVAVDPEAPLASLLNEQFWQDQPELADLGQQVIRSRGVILSYNEFVAAHNLDPTLRQTKIQYQDLLLRETYNANATTTDPAEFIYYDWNPSNPDARVTVKRGDEIDGEIYASLAANADAVMQLSEMSDIERAEAARQAALAPQTAEPGEAPPTVMTASQFAKANYGATAYGKAEAQRIVDTLATYNIDVPVDSIAWVGSGGYNLYPTVAGAQVPGLSLVGYDPNALPPDTLTEIANVLQMNLPADTELGGSFSKLVEDAKEDPELLDTLSFAMQTIGNTNPMAQTLMSQQLEPLTDPSNPIGLTVNYQVANNFGIDQGGYSPPIPDIRSLPIFGQYEAPGFNIQLTTERLGQVAATMGGLQGWGTTDTISYMIDKAESSGIPWAIVAAGLWQDTRGFQEVTDVASQKALIDNHVAMLNEGMRIHNNPALAILRYFTGDAALTEALQRQGFVDPAIAEQLAMAADTWLGTIQMFDPSFHDPTLSFAIQALNTNAGLADATVTATTTDPAAVKEQLRSVYDSLMMPVSEEQLDYFASRFHASEIAAYQPQINAYNQAMDTVGQVWKSTPLDYGSTYAGTWMFPVQGQGVHFSNDWEAPRSGHLHGGIDIMAPSGTHIVAPVAGSISSVGDDSGDGGIRVWLDGVDGNRYYFAHLSSSLTSFVGQKVPMGRVIGLVGNTGNAITTPPHLHFEIHVNGQKNPQSADPSSSGRINPYPLLAKAQAEGATSITPWQQLLGWDSSLFGEAAASAASASMMEFTRPDLEARALRAARSTALYKELFAAKPEGISDVEYATTFGNRAAQTAGVSSPEAARVGMQYNSLEAMWGRLIADEEALDESPTLRGRLHGIGQSFIDAMGGRQ